MQTFNNQGKSPLTPLSPIKIWEDKGEGETLDKNIFVSAGAGTGKTQLLVERFIELLAQKKAEVPEIVAITFTEKAAKEMKDRIRDVCTKRASTDLIWEKHKRELENSRIGTIHGFCARLIRENPIEVGIDPMSDILDEQEGLILIDKFVHKKILELVEQEDSDAVSMVSEYGLKKTKNMLKILIKNRMDVDNIKINFTTLESPEELDKKALEINKFILKIYEKTKKDFEDYKKEKALLDFDDLIIYTKRLLKEDKSIRRYYQKLIKYILVDEYQDTDFHQREIIFSLAEDSDKLFIVGDSKQSIYRFRGADVSVFEDTRRIFEKKGKLITLNINMRTIPQILEFINNLFGRIMGRDRKGKEDYEATYTDIQPARNSNVNPAIEFLSVPYNEDDFATEIRKNEAELIARRVIQLVKEKIQFKDIAILFRAMTDIKLYEDVFRRYRIPYYIIAGSGFFARQEIKDILNYLKIIEDPKDRVAMVGVLRSPMVGLSDDELYYYKEKEVRPPSFIEDLSYLREIKDKVPINFLIQEIITRTNYNAILSTQYMGEQRISNVNKLIETARRFETKGIFTLKDFIKYIDELVINEAREGEAAVSEEESNVVKIMTIHKAKGLEFPVVIIPDTSRRTKGISGPILYDKKFPWLGIKVKDEDGELQDTTFRTLIKEEIEKKELAESKRLLYVASTRVKDYLIYSGKFEEKKNTWASWLLEFAQNAKVTTAMCEAGPRTCPEIGHVRGPASHILTADILQQVEPIPLQPKTRFTATELSPKHIISDMPGLGIKTHEFFKVWDFSEKNIPEDENIRGFVKNFMQDPIFSEIKSAVEIHKELPITFKHNGYIIEGVIDLLYKKKDGNWVILDYKTDNIKKEEIPGYAKNYEIQLSIYALGINKILGINPEKLVIFFLTPGISYSLVGCASISIEAHLPLRNSN